MIDKSDSEQKSADPGGESGGRPANGASTRHRVLIIEDDLLVAMGIKQHLERLGHQVVDIESTAGGALAAFQAKTPDVVLVDIRLDGSDGIDVATRILAARRVPTIIISAFSDKTLIDRAAAAGVFGYLIKPVSAESLSAQIEVATRRFSEQETLQQEKEALTQTLENRKLVEKAKGIFMKRFSLDEPEAHRRLQQESQKRRMTIADLARKIIESAELLGE